MLRLVRHFLIATFVLFAPHARAVFLDCVFIDAFEDLGSHDAQPRAAVQQHNCARKTVVPAAATPIAPLTWSPAIATIAQAYADTCTYAHSHLPGYGENIYAAAGFTPTLKDAVVAWVDEEPYYNYAANTCSDPPPPSGSGTCGHYTQVVWDSTSDVGCGLTYCTTNSPFSGFPNWYIAVCNYTPAGNDGGRPY